jgi:hypothetical protein
MPRKAVYLLVVDGFADWEPAHAVAELRRHGEYQVESVGLTRDPVHSMGGVTIARLGLLRGRRHTSNGLEYLRSHVSGYSEAANYVDAPAVRDQKLITASGLGDVEFAHELFEELDVLTPGDRSLWAQIFRSARLPAGAA